MRKPVDHVITYAIRRGIRKNGMNRSDTAMLSTNTSIYFLVALVLTKTKTRGKFSSSETMTITLYIDTLIAVGAVVLMATEKKELVELLVKCATSVVLFILRDL